MSESSRTTGKWSEPGVPHKGWTCVDVDDLGSPSAICEMCETQSIRYVHYMTHPSFHGELGVGCVCAGKMEEDYERAKSREASVKSAAKRKRRWLTRDWNVSKNGNDYLNVNGYNIVIFSSSSTKGIRWGYKVTDRVTESFVTSRNQLPTEEAAKLKAFDTMIFMKSNKSNFKR